MKNKITCLLAGAALFGATANAEIVLAEGLSASGYIDMVATDYDNAERDTDLVEYELGLTFAPADSQWSAVVELSYYAGDSSFETVAVTYQYSDALSFSFGNIYTYQGLESHDAPNNSFISYAGLARDGVEIVDSDLYSVDFAEGISADYSSGDITLGVWAGDAVDGEDFEYFASYTGIENLTLAVALADNNDGSETTNLMATYEYDAFTLSVEDVDSEDGSDPDFKDLEVTSVAVAYNMGDTTVAVRVVDGEIAGEDYENTSIAAFQALSDNVSAGIEYSDGELGTDEVSGFAVELLYVF
jgi:hypothetical protein